jgi:coiled-coil domain-containing protein 12
MEDRKARLAALAAKAGRAASQKETLDLPANDDDPSYSKRNIHFRNYIPSDPKLLTDIKPSSAEDDELMESSTKRSRTSGSTDPPVKAKEKSVLEAALEKARAEISSTAALESRRDGSQAPHERSAPTTSADLVLPTQKKKVNDDLKRNIQPQLDRLQKRTQKAIVALLRERLEKEAANADLD